MTDSHAHRGGTPSYDVVVVGAGPAGTAAALRAAELGASVAVLEADRPGGTCVNSGCVPTRVLAKTARLVREVATADEYGVGSSAQRIDWPATVARVQTVLDRVRSIKREAERFEEAGVDYAAGDANGRDMLVQAAHFEAEAAAENAVLGGNRRTPGCLLPSGGFTDPDYAGVGLTEAQARERDPQCLVVTVPLAELDRAVIDDRERGFLKLIADRRRELILGAHAVGENAVEIVQSVTTAMAAGIDLATLADVRFAYPTYGAIVGLAARALLAEPSAGRTAERPLGGS